MSRLAPPRALSGADLDGLAAGERGTYVVVLHAPRRVRLGIAGLGRVELAAGTYAYVGSAFGPGGLGARLRHHLRPLARCHWHIDHLRRAAFPVAVWYTTAPVRLEHAWAEALSRLPGWSPCIHGFGASDCRCPTHLFRAPRY